MRSSDQHSQGPALMRETGGRDVETKEWGEMDRERKGEKGSLMNVGLGEKWQIYLNSNFATQDLFN